MKFTKFYSIFKIYNKNILLNTYNSSLIELSDEVLISLKNALKNNNFELLNKQYKEILVKEGFLINEDEDDNRYNLIKSSYLKSKYSNQNTIKIDIGITNKCNFNCKYCFENGNKEIFSYKNHLSDVEKLFDYLKDYVNTNVRNNINNLEIVWYGGEPSLDYPEIIKINKYFSKDAKQKNYKYNNVIITNGFFIPSYFLSEISEQNIKYLQITLDGPKKYHNERRNLKDPVDSYSIIMDNIAKLLKANVDVVIRINVDKNNYRFINKLYKDLNFKFNKYIGEKLFINLGRVFGSSDSFSQYEYVKKYGILFKNASNLNLIKGKFEVGQFTAFCSAETCNKNLVIDYKGNIYKCWNDIFDIGKMVGNIYNKKILNKNIESMYLENLSLENVNKGRCLKCKYIKYCGGFCPHTRLLIANGNEECIYNDGICKRIIELKIKTNLKEILK